MTDEERLAAFERMMEDVQAELAAAEDKLVQMRAQGKTKTVSYRELFGRKMTLQTIITTYRHYGLL